MLKDKAISVSNESGDAWFAKADLEYSLGDLQSSIESYQKAISLDPNNYDVWFKLGEAYFESGNYEKAAHSFDRCISINPKHANSHYGKAKILIRLEKTKDAIDCLKSAFELDPVIKTNFVRDYPEVKSSKFFSSLIEESK